MKVEIALGEAKEDDERYKELLEYFIQLKKPYIFDPYVQGNILQTVDFQLQDTVNIFEEMGQINVRDLDEFSYFHKIAFLNKKSKPNASQQSEFSSVE